MTPEEDLLNRLLCYRQMMAIMTAKLMHLQEQKQTCCEIPERLQFQNGAYQESNGDPVDFFLAN